MPVGPDDGTDFEPAEGSDEGDRDPLPAGEQGGQRCDLGELCATTPWHRGHARKALAAALRPTLVRAARRPRTTGLRAGSRGGAAVLLGRAGAPTVQRLAPVMAELVPTLRRFAELEVSDEVAAGLVVIAASTMDRRRAPDRAAMSLRGRSHTKPGSAAQGRDRDPVLDALGRCGAWVRGDRSDRP